MPINISTGHVSNYQLVFPFLPFLEVGTETERGDSILLYLKSVQLPEVNLERTLIDSQYITHKEPSNRITYTDLEVTFAVSELFTNYKFIYNWMTAAKDPEVFGIYGNKKCEATLHILSNNKNPKVSFTLIDLYPVRISDIPFDYTNSDGEDLVVSATFSLNYFKVS